MPDPANALVTVQSMHGVHGWIGQSDQPCLVVEHVQHRQTVFLGQCLHQHAVGAVQLNHRQTGLLCIAETTEPSGYIRAFGDKRVKRTSCQVNEAGRCCPMTGFEGRFRKQVPVRRCSEQTFVFGWILREFSCMFTRQRWVGSSG